MQPVSLTRLDAAASVMPPATVNGHNPATPGPGAHRAPQRAGAAWARWMLTAVVVAGACVIAAIGFAGSYAAVRQLAVRKGFGGFAPYFPIGIDAGIVVLLALDLLLTWRRIGYPLLRQAAWLLTLATVAFNAAAAWPDALGVGMHAVIPLLFIVCIEAARHAVGRTADLTADRHMDGIRAARWLLAPRKTFRLWRRMKLWEIRSYTAAVTAEQDRLVYREQLRATHGQAWHKQAPADALLVLRLMDDYGLPLAEARTRATRDAIDADAPAHPTARIPAAPAPASPDASGPRPDRTPSAASGTTPDASRPGTDADRRALLRRLAADGQAPASIRQAAQVLGCRQATAKQLLIAEGLHPSDANTPSRIEK